MRGTESGEDEEEKGFRGCREVRALIRCHSSDKKGVFPWKKASPVLSWWDFSLEITTLNHSFIMDGYADGRLGKSRGLVWKQECRSPL